MTLVAIASAKASPGVTTLALGLALSWPRGSERSVMLLEADPDGGSLAARMGLGFEPGLGSLAVTARRGIGGVDLADHAQELAVGVKVVCAPASADHAHAAVVGVAGPIAHRLRLDETTDAIVDLGRLTTRSPGFELARAADLVLLVARPTIDEVQCLPSRARTLADAGCRVGLVCVGSRPYAPDEVARAASADLVGVVADDSQGAGALMSGVRGERVWRRSLLCRSTADLASRLAAVFRPTIVMGLDDSAEILSEASQSAQAVEAGG